MSKGCGIYTINLYLIEKVNTSCRGSRAWPLLPYWPGCGRCVSKVCSWVHKPTFELHRTPCRVTPLPDRCSGDHYPLPLGALGRAPSFFWLPLSGDAPQRPERKGQRAVPVLDSRKIFTILCGGGDGGGVELDDGLLGIDIM